MYYISDYINYYKNTDTEKIKWNVMDNLICAVLVYLPAESFSESRTLEEFSAAVMSREDREYPGSMIPLAFEVLKGIEGSVRYRNMVISDFRNDRSQKAQFGAMTVRKGNTTVIAYKGTDHSIIGWMENFRIAYDYPTCTQNLAIEYMKKNIKLTDREVFVAGHSKGGNLAMAGAMEMGENIFRRIKEVCNFDGPGFRKEEFYSSKYERLSRKLVNIVPAGSIVGMLLYNKDYKVVETSPSAINEHHPDTWRVFGEFFVEDTLSGLSMRLHENTISSVEKFTGDEAEEIFESLFSSIEEEYTADLSLSPEKVFSLIRNIKDTDEELSGNLYEILKSLLW